MCLERAARRERQSPASQAARALQENGRSEQSVAGRTRPRALTPLSSPGAYNARWNNSSRAGKPAPGGRATTVRVRRPAPPAALRIQVSHRALIRVGVEHAASGIAEQPVVRGATQPSRDGGPGGRRESLAARPYRLSYYAESSSGTTRRGGRARVWSCATTARRCSTP